MRAPALRKAVTMPEPLLLALDTLPRHAYPFLWADYVELLCLCSRLFCKRHHQRQERPRMAHH